MSLILAFILVFSSFGLIPIPIGNPLVTSRTYTTDADFNEGILVGLDAVNDQLNLSTEHVTLPFIWVPNNEGTVSKVNTETGDELGRYWVAPPDPGGVGKSSSPSRTTVDLQGSCWVGNRDAGTVVKIGLYEAGIWEDRNDNGICETSLDLDGDGVINSTEILPWGEDECVLFEVVLIKGKEGTFTPGNYIGGYDTNHWRTSPRSLAVDENNNLWAASYSPCYFYHINGETGAIDFDNIVYIPGHYAYGAVIDENGILWSTNRPTNHGTPHILRFNTSDQTSEKIYLTPSRYMSYGLGLDYLGHLFASGWTHYSGKRLHRLNITRPLGASFPDIGEFCKWGPNRGRGVACTSDNDVWVVSTGANSVYRFYNNGTFRKSIYVGPSPTGVAVDGVGKVWVCNNGDDTIVRINTTDGGDGLGAVDLVVPIVGSKGHYSYSDMTGIMARTITTRIGTWTVIFDSGEAGTPWGKISWNSLNPEGTFVTVKVRSSDDQLTWSPWEDTFNDVQLSSTPDGRYLQIETTLQIIEGEESPILYDLTVNIGYILATVDFDPDTLNQKSKGKWVTVYIELPEGFDVQYIDITTVELSDVDLSEWITAELKPNNIGDHDGDGIPDLMVKFVREEVIELLDHGESVIVTISGALNDGTPFIGTDVIRVIH